MKKNFWKYFTITVLLLFALICVAILYLFFVPGADIFGLTYISKKEDSSSLAYEIDKYNINCVSLESNALEVRVSEAESNAVSLFVHNAAFGFTIKKHSHLTISESFENNRLNFVVEEPSGAIAKGGSYIELKLPKEFQFDLFLKNNKATTKINLSTQGIKTLSYNTSSGDCNFNSGTISGNLELNLGRSKFNVAEDVELNNSSVVLALSSGRFTCHTALKEVYVLQTNSGAIEFKECGELNFEHADAGGSVTADKVADAKIVGGDTNLNFKSLGRGNIELKKSGKVEIGEITDASTEIITNTGNINIGKTQVLELFLTTQSGDISVGDAYSMIKANTTSGTIIVSFASDAPHYVPNAQGGNPSGARSLTSTVSEDGKVAAYGLEHANITLQGKGSANLYFENVFGISEIDGGNGNVYIEIKELREDDPSGLGVNGWAHYMLVTEGVSPFAGSVSVNTHQINEEGTGGYRTKDHKETKINPNNQNAQVFKDNQLIAHISSGSLTIRDSLMAAGNF